VYTSTTDREEGLEEHLKNMILGITERIIFFS